MTPPAITAALDVPAKVALPAKRNRLLAHKANAAQATRKSPTASIIIPCHVFPSGATLIADNPRSASKLTATQTVEVTRTVFVAQPGIASTQLLDFCGMTKCLTNPRHNAEAVESQTERDGEEQINNEPQEERVRANFL
jgi:hypothetical protein